MRQTAHYDRMEREMRAGAISAEGFLGSDGRRLVHILAEDEAALARLGLTREGLARRMGALRDAGAKGLGLAVTVEDRFEVTVDEVRGKLPCPFGHEGLFPKVNTTVRNLVTGREIVYTDLSIHLIEDHGFFQGRGARFRLDPADLAAVLEVEPEESRGGQA